MPSKYSAAKTRQSISCGGNGASVNTTSTSGEDNTGGGGGGGNQRYGSSAGGSGIVVIRGVNQSQNYSSMTLKYDNMGGSGCYSKSVVTTEVYGLLCTPVKSGYTFDGWYTSMNGGTLVTKDTLVTKETDHTIYAHWTKATKPVITFETNGNIEYTKDGISSRIIVTKGDSTLDTKTFKYIFSKDSNAEPTNSFINGNTYSLNEGEGIYYLIAEACDINGECTRKVSEPFYLDTVEPEATIDLSISDNSINVVVNANDSGSGIKNYGYLIQTDSICPVTGYTATVNNNYSFNGLSSGTYYVCVKIIDNTENSYIISNSIEYIKPSLILFDNGVDNTAVTGGWVGVGDAASYGFSIKNGSLYLDASYDTAGYFGFKTAKSINLSDYSTLNAIVTTFNGPNPGKFSCGSVNTSIKTGTITIDVSSISSSEVISFLTNTPGTNYEHVKLFVSKVWLE